MVPDSARSQVYTESDIGSIALPLPAWDMLNNEFNNGYTYGSGSLPTGLNPSNIIESQVTILENANPSTGRPSFGQPLYRLNWRQSKDGTGGSAYNGPWNGGGQFHLKCSDSPVQCATYMARGPVSYNFNGTLKSKSWFADSRFSTNTASRGFLKLDYLKTGVTPPSQVIREFIIPIGPWNMTVNASNSPNERRVQFGTTLDITKIASVTAVIYSDPDPVTGETNVDYFDRRGNLHFFDVGGRGGEYEYSSTNVTLRLIYKLMDFGTNANAFNTNHSLANFNRGWVKISYVGTTPNQPYAVKSKFKKLGGWLIQDSDDPKDEQVNMNLPFGDFGVAANRLTHIETTVHSDYINATEHTLTSLRRITNDVDRGSYSDHGLFAVEEAKGVVTMLARGYNRQAGPPITYFSYNHANPGPYNRGWFRMDYLAGSCAQGPAGFSIQGIPGTQVGNCAGTNQPFLVEGAGEGMRLNASTDEFTYVYKRISNVPNITITVRVEGQDVNTTDPFGLAGVMIRASLASNSRNASMLTTRLSANGHYFTRRITDGAGNQRDQIKGKPTVCWVRLKKVGNVITAYYSASTSTTVPADASFNSVGAPQTISFPSTSPYYVGMAVSNLTNGKLSKVTFRNFTQVPP
jgi:hypothetical protein